MSFELGVSKMFVPYDYLSVEVGALVPPRGENERVLHVALAFSARHYNHIIRIPIIFATRENSF